MRPLFDTHFHIEPEDDPDALLADARQAGVEYFLAVASTLAEARRLVDVADTFENTFTTVGVHPHEAAGFDGDIEPYRQLARLPAVKAIGEIGLDYHYEHSPRDRQKEVLRTFLQLAAEENLPSVIHCRDAYDDCLRVLHETLADGQAVEIHSFTGDPDWARKVLALGAMFSFNGIVTFKKAHNVRRALDVIPLDRLLLETDAPYLAPEPYRGKRNTPVYLPAIAERIAAEKGRAPDDIAAITTDNGRRFFRVGDALPPR